MLKIRALNRESSSDEDIPVIRREAQEEIVLEQYNKALRLQATDQSDGAKEILLNLLNDNIPLLENNGGLPSSMSTLKYSCYVNIGNIYIKTGELDNALDNYLTASELDSTDVTLWHKIGKLAIKQNRFRQAAYAFSKGLECSESHWPCLDQIISLLFAMKDTVNCLMYIGKALTLDSDYTKGLVLRKQIYKDNPYTWPYYQKYNPDYIWEPPLDVTIDEDDEKIILEKEKILSDQISEVEKSLGPKPLKTIPLPKALDDYSWLSLGKVVIELHQYITNNEMSHLTMVDLTKCMSQNDDVIMEIVPNVEIPVEKVVEETPIEKKSEEVEEEKEKMEVEVLAERRPSQNSETNNEGQENTPNQTDNDEEQAMEQDGDEQDENNDSKNDKNRSLNKSNKRKRDLLSDLQIWGWHSKRKSAKKGKSDKDFTVEDALNRIIPSKLLRHKIGDEKYNQFEDSMSTIDMYNMYAAEQGSVLSPIHSPKSSTTEEYFGSEHEKEDILNIWNQPRECCDAVILIRDFVIALSKLWHLKWPEELIKMYIDAYTMYREHYDHPQVFSGDSPFCEMRDDALATLLYGELLNFSSSKSETRTIHITSLAFLQVISGWEEDWKEEFPAIFLRVYWLRAHTFRKEGSNDLAISALELMQEVIEERMKNDEKYLLSLPNCLKCNCINSEVISKILKHLDMITSLNCIEELYNEEKYREVAEILKLTFGSSGNHPTCGKMGRPAQLAMLLHSLWYTDLTECFVWTEECLYEAHQHFLKPVRDFVKWEKVVEKCLAFFHEIIKMETVGVIDALSEEKRARLVGTLAKIVCKQLNVENTSKIPLGCITTWILLHYVLVREEHRQQASKKVSHVKTDKTDNHIENNDNQTDELPPSVAILFSAHEFLGPKGWCLTGNGELLHFMLDTILDRLDTPIFEPLREKIDIHIEQAMFCLYQHPSKKNKVSRHLADHNVDPLSLTWERAFQLYDFYGPDCLPEFNSYKNASITSDLEQLLQRIIALVPSTMDPQPHMPKLLEFIQGKSTELPEPINFSNKVRAIYYLIGDYYFKQREFTRCIKYFMMDLCINPNRLDSWACIGLSYISQLENKLNYCKKLKSEMEFLDKAKCAQVSFRKALDLEKDHIMLWIEYGSFEYMVHSFCSRVMKAESDTLSMERFEYLENQKDNYLESSGRNFEKAIQLYQPDESEPDERWLQYYILGKVAEKKQREPQEYLKQYVTASKLLHENNCMYPDKINYHNPQHLSVEALELHYRMNASILKYLELHEGKEIPNSIGNMFKEQLDKSYFPKKTLTKQAPVIQTQTTETTNKGVTEKAKSEEIMEDVKNCLEDMLNKVVKQTKKETDGGADVIMIISDSEEETKTVENNAEVELPKDGKDVQDFLDKMMEETMKKTEEQEPDSDTSITSKIVVEVKEESNKVNRESKIKSGSETETDIRTSVDESSSSQSSSSSSSSSSDSDSDDDSSTSSSSSSSETTNGNMSNGEILALIDRCVVGLEQCIIRLPQNYKAIYRLAHLYFNYKPRKDFNKCKQLLLGEYTCKGGIVITGLFSDRKNHNFFNGIWRIPSSEIDRPGSLSAHMSRCIALLLQVLRATNDNKLLLDLSLQFRKSPDPDKIYIKDSERIQFADQAMTMCIQSLRSQIHNIPNMNDTAIQRLLIDIFRSYQRIQKNEPSKESTFASMLTDVYKKMKKGNVPENANVLDLATKFCQQNRLAEKQKRQMQNQAALLRGPGVANPPVLPPPSTVGPSAQPPLKRPGMGRPRGRPPLPKIPGQTRVPRGRSPNVTTNPFSWQKSFMDQNATYNYLKHYQEELIKQYSQSLSLTQLTQLSQYLTQNQLASALAQSTFNNQFTQFLAGQSPIMNNPNLLKQMSSSQLWGDLSKSGSQQKKTDQDNPKLSKKNLPQTITSAAQVTKVKSTVPSSVYSANLSQSNQPINLGNKSKTYPSKAETITHSVTSMSQVPITCKTKAVYTQSAFKSTYTGSMTYGPAEISKIAKSTSTAITKTTSSSQVFKEPLMTKAHSTIHHKSMDKTANILMKDRPNISITPVLQSNIPLITTSSFMTPSQPGSSKTLQEKLADKQKQHSTKQLGRNIEAEIISAPLGQVKKSLNIPSIPSALTVSKASSSPYKFPLDSGISISQIPVTQPYKHSTEAINLQQRKEPSQKIPKPVTETNLPPNLPLSLCVSKKPERKESSDDDVILIE